MGGEFEGQGRNVLRATARRRPVADCFDRTMKDYGVGKFALRLRVEFLKILQKFGAVTRLEGFRY